MSTQPYSDANKALLLSRLKNHITALINHYQDKIYVWDVVNEAIDEGRLDGFRSGNAAAGLGRGRRIARRERHLQFLGEFLLLLAFRLRLPLAAQVQSRLNVATLWA